MGEGAAAAAVGRTARAGSSTTVPPIRSLDTVRLAASVLLALSPFAAAPGVVAAASLAADPPAARPSSSRCRHLRGGASTRAPASSAATRRVWPESPAAVPRLRQLGQAIHHRDGERGAARDDEGRLRRGAIVVQAAAEGEADGDVVDDRAQILEEVRREAEEAAPQHQPPAQRAARRSSRRAPHSPPAVGTHSVASLLAAGRRASPENLPRPPARAPSARPRATPKARDGGGGHEEEDERGALPAGDEPRLERVPDDAKSDVLTDTKSSARHVAHSSTSRNALIGLSTTVTGDCSSSPR